MSSYWPRKSIWQNPTPFHYKNMQQTRNKRNFYNLIKGIYKQNPQLKRYTMVKEWMLSLYYQNQENRIHSCHLYLTLVLEVPAMTIWQEKEIKGIQLLRKKQNNFYLQISWSCLQKVLENPLKTIRNTKWIQQGCKI